MWKKLLAFGHAIGFTSNETTVLLFLTGAILAGLILRIWQEDLSIDAPDFTEAYRIHDSLFAARASAVIDIPSDSSRPAMTAPRAERAEEHAAHRIVNINKAGKAALESLPGVGPSTAARIIEHRSASGPFSAIEDIMNVPGIGPKKFERMKPYLSIK